MKRLFTSILIPLTVMTSCSPGLSLAEDRENTYVTQAEIDAVAAINKKDQTLEHSTLMFTDGTSYSPIVTGDEYSVGVRPVLDQIDPRRFRDITALIHSHPRETSGDHAERLKYDEMNKGPSPSDDNVGVTMCIFTYLAGSDRGYFDMIIIGPDDTPRTYRYDC